MAEVILENVCKNYRGVEAVKNLSLVCEDKEFLALLGPSGCGKSSTLRMIAGLEEITSGKIYIGKRLVNDLSPRERNLGLAFENYALYPHLTVYENIVFPLRARGYSDEKIKKIKRVDELINLFNLRDKLKNFPKSLSGGEAQLVSLARCLVKDVDVYLLDEPLSHLDEELKVNMRTILKIMHNKMKRTFIYVTHDQLEAFALADKVAVINFGILQQVDTPENIYENPTNKFVASFIGEPPINFLNVHVISENNELYLSGKSYKLLMPKKYKNKVIRNKEYILGIRPECIIVSNKISDLTPILAKVLIFENLGEVNQITMLLDNQTIITETEPNFKTEMNKNIYIGLNLEKVHLFDIDTLQSIGKESPDFSRGMNCP